MQNVSEPPSQVTAPTFQLDVPFAWSYDQEVLWYRHNYLYWRLNTYGDDYKEIHDFPQGKPDIDLFYPLNSRGFRGWWQVRHTRRPSLLTAVFPHAQHSAPRTAADIPQELFQRILETMTEGLEVDKHQLACCGQVCRYWARLCQRGLFESPKLRERADILTLYSFIQPPSSHIRDCVECLLVTHKLMRGQTPWLHLLQALPLPNLLDVCVALDGAERPGDTHRRLRSIHGDVPRTLPPYFSQRITILGLNDIHFDPFADLLHLVGELHCLTNLSCRRVTCNSLPTAAAVPMRGRRRRYSLGAVRFYDCGFADVPLAAVLVYDNLHRCIDNDLWAVLLSLRPATEAASEEGYIVAAEGDHTHGLSICT